MGGEWGKNYSQVILWCLNDVGVDTVGGGAAVVAAVAAAVAVGH